LACSIVIQDTSLPLVGEGPGERATLQIALSPTLSRKREREVGF
jgi:hypothetical protein